MKLEHYWQDLPKPNYFNGATIYAEQVALAQDGAVFVELGAWKGRSAACMGVEIANSGKQIRFYTIDTWRGSDEEEHQADEDVRGGRLFEVFTRNILPVQRFVTPIRSDSSLAAGLFDDQSVDFLYIDADHTYAGCSRDLHSWYRKIKPGGLLSGDDWDWAPVMMAVSSFAKSHSLTVRLQAGSTYTHLQQWLIEKPRAGIRDCRE